MYRSPIRWLSQKKYKWTFTFLRKLPSILWALSTFLLANMISINNSYLKYEYDLIDINPCIIEGENSCFFESLPKWQNQRQINTKVQIKLKSGSIDEAYILSKTYKKKGETVEKDFYVTKLTDGGLENNLLSQLPLPYLEGEKSEAEIKEILLLGNNKDENGNESVIVSGTFWIVIVDKSGNYKIDSVFIVTKRAMENIPFEDGNGSKIRIDKKILKMQRFHIK